ncbi:hypothetical protein BJ875DRAFT_395094 [Amylocarpus encephaloides]|uniref:AMP-dependent synthetase/ligase domain-containing protein n=1 Tax=Amylocarpus encephaloides TaxID=45428 RepID=A0A9P7YPM7_9HELO|nr:hypothetical protein BJ875DRAFT_395094 [Amylocarpus encephaloides]
MFQPPQYFDIPHLDLLSWTLGNTNYDLDKPLFVNARDPIESVSYNQATSYIRKLIAGFRAKGLQSGDSVCLHSFNSVYYSLIYLSVIGFGGRFVGSNPAYTIAELEHLFRITGVSLVLTEPDLLHNVLVAAKVNAIPESKILGFSSSGQPCSTELDSWRSLLQHGEIDWETFDDEERAKGTIVALMSTSGTTGMPKAAEISHYSQVAQSVMLYDSEAKQYPIRRLLCLPQFHAFNAPLAHLAPLREGHTTYVMRRYHPKQYTQFLAQYQITETTMVNPIIFNLLSMPDTEHASLDSLRFVWCGGVTLDASVQNKLSSILNPEAAVAQVWGMTEVGWITTMHYPEKDTTGAVGRLLPNTEAKLLDPIDGTPITQHSTRGEIYIRSPSVMTAYVSNSSATEETIMNGWLRTGDIGYVSEDGKWYVVDRAKELIKVRGWQVSPTEIEACLSTHPKIRDAAVIGVDFGDEKGEVPRGYVVLESSSESKLTNMERELKSYLSGRLANYKALDGGVKIVKSIPRSAAGKILRKVLKEGWRKGMETKRGHVDH